MRYSNKWKTVAWILIVLFLIALASIIFQGCSDKKYHAEGNILTPYTDREIWALIKINNGEPLHIKVVDWQASSTGNIYIYTEDRMYVTSTVNVLLIEDLG